MGTLPVEIARFATALKRGVPATEHIQSIVRAAAVDLAAFVHKPILKALLASPDGVSTCKFAQVFDREAHLAEPKDVAEAMRNSKGIVHHKPAREYRLASRAHRTALLEVIAKQKPSAV